LYLNQRPVFDYFRHSDIFWVGLSAVQFESGIECLPLSPNTRTGGLISNIESKLKPNFSFYKTNIVKCLPLNEDGKIRYPIEHEMMKCYPNFEMELKTLNPSVVFLLGKQVATFVMKKFGAREVLLPTNYQYKPLKINDTYFVCVHHPSFMLVYKRKEVPIYTKNIQVICQKLANAKLNLMPNVYSAPYENNSIFL